MTLPHCKILAFALNDEAFANFGYASYKKVHDVALEVVRVAYGHTPSHFYFFGHSEGGREALMMAQRFPQDYDGVVSIAPAVGPAGLLARHAYVGLLQRNGGWLFPEKVVTLQKAVLAACDELDGLRDGVVGNIQECIRTFDPMVSRCEGGQNNGNECFSDAEIAIIRAMHSPYEFGFSLANNEQSYPGWGYGAEAQPGGMKDLLTGLKRPQFPALSMAEQSQGWIFGNMAVRYFFAKDAKFEPSKFTPQLFAARMREVSELIDATNPDLSAFSQRGGKLLIRTNLADYIVGPFATMDYYKSVAKLMGNEVVDHFVRFYVSPGSVHGGAAFSGVDGSPVPYQADLLTVLDSWLEKGEVPAEKLTQTLHTSEAPFSVIASRPMCVYPAYPHYLGSGDWKSADSYECRRP
jgi:pimeloyl-ACP methyl ester carboxylesterase